MLSTKIRKQLFFVCIYLLLSTFNSYAQEKNTIQVEENTFDFVQPKFQILEDKNYSLEKILNQEFDSKFIKYDSVKIPEGESVYWLKITIQNNTSKNQTAILGNNHFDFLTLYYKNAKDSLIIEKSGNMYPNEKKKILRGGDSYLAVELAPKQRIICYLKGENKDAPFFRFINLDWVVYSKTVFDRHAETQKILLYIFLGACGVMFLYNLILLVLIREGENVLYVLYNLSLILFVLDTSGEWFEWFASNAHYQNAFNVYIGTIQVNLLSLFAIAILHLRSRMPKMFKFQMVTIGAGFFTLVLYFFGFYNLQFMLAIVINMIINISILLISIYSIIKGYKPAYYFFAGFLVYYTFSTIFALQAYRILPYELFSLIPINLFEVAIIVELSLFSLGLGYKVNMIREELRAKELEQERLKREEEEKRNALIQQQNEELEGKVEERTKELAETNNELQQINEEMVLTLDALQEKSNIIERKSQAINDSIAYAQRIQEAILPYEQDLKKSVNDYFILFRPKDVVSGDFYWFAQKDDSNILAVIDCTGHGVPGAFMSLIANELLNHIVDDRHITFPEQILNELHKGIRKALKQKETKNRDGMDMAIVNINQKEKKLSFAGARNPIVYIQNDELHLIKGDKLSIGGEQKEKERAFKKYDISLESALTFYLFSDGYQDQFGGPEGRKFSPRRLRQIFYEIHQKSLEEQKEVLDNKLDSWKGNETQIDDILIIGAEIK